MLLILTSSVLVANPKNYSYFTRWPIPPVVCLTEKREQKRKCRSASPPPPLLAPVQDCFDSSIGPRGVASQKKNVSVCDNNFHGLVVSFFSWRCLATSTFYVPHAATNILLPSVTVSTHTSSSDAVVFQSPAMPNARMSLCTQSVHSFSFPPCPLRTAP